MSKDKGKGRERENPETRVDVRAAYSTVAASANGLAHSIFLPFDGSSYKTLRNADSSLTGLEKTSMNTSTDGFTCVEGYEVVLPKLIPKTKFHSFKLDHFEPRIFELEREFSRFLEGTNSLVYSPLAKNEETSRTKNLSPAFNIMGIKNPTNISIDVQEHHDGQDVVDLLSTLEQTEFEHEMLSGDFSAFDSSSSSLSSPRLAFKTNSLDSPPPRHASSYQQGAGIFFPNFENSAVHHHQWLSLQESYTDLIWGRCLDTMQQVNACVKKSSGDKARVLQTTAKRRLEAVWYHLRD